MGRFLSGQKVEVLLVIIVELPKVRLVVVAEELQ